MATFMSLTQWTRIVVQIIKFKNTNGYPVIWDQQYTSTVTTNVNYPVHLFNDQSSTNEFFIMGTIDTAGALMRLYKTSGKVDWYIKF